MSHSRKLPTPLWELKEQREEIVLLKLRSQGSPPEPGSRVGLYGRSWGQSGGCCVKEYAGILLPANLFTEPWAEPNQKAVNAGAWITKACRV